MIGIILITSRNKYMDSRIKTRCFNELNHSAGAKLDELVSLEQKFAAIQNIGKAFRETTEKINWIKTTTMARKSVCVSECECESVCVCVRERERERETKFPKVLNENFRRRRVSTFFSKVLTGGGKSERNNQ